ncbi:MAG: hypothetical protein WC683_09465 [bacterium]
MPLQRQIINIPVGAGVDEIAGSMGTPAGKFAVATNARIVDVGTIEQRPGYAAMAATCLDGSSVVNARRLMRCGDEILLDDGNAIYTYVADADKWRAVDHISEATIAKRIPGEKGFPAQLCNCDATWCSGMYAHAWVGPVAGAAGSYVHVRLTDEITGARLETTTWVCALSSQVRIFALPSTTKVVVWYTRINIVGGARELVFRYVDVAAPITWSAEVTVVSLALNTPWDVQPMSSTRSIAIYTGAGAGAAVMAEIDTAGMVLDSVAVTFTTTSVATICYDSSGDCLYASYCAPTPNGLRIAKATRLLGLALSWDNQLDADVYTAAVPMTRVVGMTYINAVGARVVCSINADTARPAQTRATITNNAGVVSATVSTTYHVQAMGVPRWIGTRLYVVGYLAPATSVGTGTLVLTNPPQHAAYLFEVPDAAWPMRPVARIAWAQAQPGGTQSMPIGLNLCTVGYVSAVSLLSENLSVAATPAEQQEGFDLYALDWTPEYAPLGVEQDGELIMSGGVPNCYCGDRVGEYGFHYYPSAVHEVTAVAGALPAGSYGYAFCFVHRDDRGVLHRSAPTYLRATADGSHEVALYVTQYCTTTRMDLSDASYPVEIEMYRTLDAGYVYYHVSTAQGNPAAHTCVFSDIGTITAATLIARRQLYTNGDVLPNKAPPAFRHVAVHNNRLWGISCDDVDRIWLSKLASLREGQGFDERLSTRVLGSELMALASLDGKLLAFGRHEISVFFGSGPTDTNQNSDLSDPQPVSSEHGCVDARSVCVFPGGVTFQGNDGLLYVVETSMQVKCVSLPVYDTLHTYPIINSVSYSPDDHELRVVCTKSAIATSCVLVWNTLMDQWHVWMPKNAAGAYPPAVGGTMIAWSGEPDRFAMLLTSGVVLRESGYVDADATYPTVTLRTGPLALSGVQSFQRVWDVGVLFEKLVQASSSDVVLTAYNDHLTGSSTWTSTWTAAECTSAQTMPRLQLNAHVPVSSQKCEAIALQIAWTPVGGKNQRLQALSLLIGAKAGKPRILPAAARK